MPTLYFLKPCTVLLNDEERTKHGKDRFTFTAGKHDDVPDDIAEMPYVKAHVGKARQVGDAGETITPAPTDTVSRADYDALAAEVETLRARVAELEQELADEREPDEVSGDFVIRRGYQGKYRIVKITGDTEEEVAGGLTKVEAEAKVAEMKAAS